MKFGEKLKVLRGETRQEKLAEKVGVSPSSITHFETGRRNPDPATFVRLCDALGVTPDELAPFLPPDCETARIYRRPYVIPLHGVVSAGDGADEEYNPPEPLPVSDYFPAGSMAYKVTGDSMVDHLIGPGDFVIVRPDPEPVIGDKVVVFVPDHGTLVKIKRKGHYASANDRQSREPIARVAGCREYGVLIGVIRRETGKKK